MVRTIFSDTLIAETLTKHGILISATGHKLLPYLVGFDGQIFYLKKVAQ